jgi:uncharacterized protein (TIGR00251 family)
MFKEESEKFYDFKNDNTFLKVRVTAKASANAITGVRSGALLVSVTVVPENNKANLEVIKLLGDKFGVAKSKIKIVSGEKCKNKIVCIDGKIHDIEKFYLDIIGK